MMNESEPSYYCTKDQMWCAIPFSGKQFIIVRNGRQVHLCRTFDTAKNYIEAQLKKK